MESFDHVSTFEDPYRKEIGELVSALHLVQLKQSDYLSRCTRKCLERLPTYRDQVIETGVIQIVSSMEKLLNSRNETLATISREFRDSSPLIDFLRLEK